MSDFAKFCPKCYVFFRDPDLHAKHVETCGYARETTGSRRQTAAEEKKASKRQTVAEAKRGNKPQTAGETADCRRQTAADASGEEIPSESAANCDLPSAVPAEGDMPSAVATEGGSPQVKSPKFKT